MLNREGHTGEWQPYILRSSDIEILAVYTINKYTISFNTGGGSEVAPITRDYGTAIIALEDFVKEGFIFHDRDLKLPETMPSQDMVLEAVWIESACGLGGGGLSLPATLR